MREAAGVPAPRPAPQLSGSKRKLAAAGAGTEDVGCSKAARRLAGIAFLTSAMLGLLPLQQLLQRLPAASAAAGPPQQDGQRDEACAAERPAKRQAAGPAAPEVGHEAEEANAGAPLAEQQPPLPAPLSPQPQQLQDGCQAMEVEQSPAPVAASSQEPAAAELASAAAAGDAEKPGSPQQQPSPPHAHVPPALGPLSAQKPLSRSQLRQQLQLKRSAAAGAGPAGRPAAAEAQGPLSAVHSAHPALQGGRLTRGNRLLGLVKHQGQALHPHPHHRLLAPQQVPTPEPPELFDPPSQPAELATGGEEAPADPVLAAVPEGATGEGPSGARSPEQRQLSGGSQQAQRRLTQSPFRLLAGRSCPASSSAPAGGREGPQSLEEEQQEGASSRSVAALPEQQQQEEEQQEQQEPPAASGPSATPPTPTPVELPSLPDGLLAALQGGSPPAGPYAAGQVAGAAEQQPQLGEQGTPAKASGSSAAGDGLGEEGGHDDTPGPSPLLGGPRGCAATAMQRVGQIVADLTGGDDSPAASPVPLAVQLTQPGPYISKRRRSLLGAIAGQAVAAGCSSPATPAAAQVSSCEQQGAEQHPAEAAGQQEQQLELSPAPAAALASCDEQGAPAASPLQPFPGFWGFGASEGPTPAGLGAAATPGQAVTDAHQSQPTPELLGFLGQRPPPQQQGPAAQQEGAPAAEGAQRAGSGSPGRGGRRERKVRFAVECGPEEEGDEEGAAAPDGEEEPRLAGSATPQPPGARLPLTGRPGTPAKPLSKMRVPAPPAYARFGSTAFRRYSGPAGRRAALLSFVSETGASCVAVAPGLPPPSPQAGGWDGGDESMAEEGGEEEEGAEAVGGELGCAAGDGAMNIPRRLNHPHALARRLSMAEPPSPKDTALLDLREAFMNARLADSWARGEAWARLDLAGVELEGAKAPQYRQKLEQLCAVLGEAQGREVAERVVAQLEAEWRHLQHVRQRYAPGAAVVATAQAAAAGEPAEEQRPAACGSPAGGSTPRAVLRPAPHGILKQPSPLGLTSGLLQPSPCPSPAGQQGPAGPASEPAAAAAVGAAEGEAEAEAMDVCPASPYEEPLAAQPAAAGPSVEAQAPPREAAAAAAEGAAGEEGPAVQQAALPEARAQGAAEGDASTPPGEDEGDAPLQLTPDAAVELTPGPAPSRGMKMLQSAGASGGGGSALSGLTPSRAVALAFPPQPSDRGAPARPGLVLASGAGPAGDLAKGRRQQKLSRGARLLQALQAGGHRTGGGGGGSDGAAAAPPASGALTTGGAAPALGPEAADLGGAGASGGSSGRASRGEEDIWSAVLAVPL